ncbi:lycopene cyclase family protein [Cerasicoccus fimbriatus]|uniref:lycopene cyclase family protein n=1 Tax=Cerasicoccus fimbriatus TaxID=3014554 RepID=UPI0022B4DDDD|nr:lycopene cyclase family protein [Cerasicoccus sp. TK19100]
MASQLTRSQPDNATAESGLPHTRNVTIYGAGAAGTILALELINAGYEGGIQLLDRRQHFYREQRWCFWGEAPEVLSSLSRRQWPEWEVVSSLGRRVHGSPSTPYQEVYAPDFYQWAHHRLQQHDNVSFRFGEDVETPSLNGAIQAGETLVDCTGYRETGSPSLWQSFLGWEVISERNVFPSDRATIMDHRAEGPGISFGYVLPTSTKRAFIELTCFHPEMQDATVLEPYLQRYIESHFGRVTRVERVEQGCLPMQVEQPHASLSSNYYCIGAGAGALRASSGYSFLAICQQAKAVAQRIHAGHGECWRRPGKYALLDQIFLRVLRSETEMATEIFDKLFGHAPTESLIRFLQDKSSLSDDFRIVMSLPKRPFLRALFSNAG